MKAMWVGSLLYLSSFLMPAAKFLQGGDWFNKPIPGWRCAYLSPLYPFMMWNDHGRVNWNDIVVGLAGMTNIVFLLSFLPFLQKRFPKTVSSLRLATLVGLGFCLIVFWTQHLMPLMGFFVWVTSILLLLYTARNSHEGKTGD